MPERLESEVLKYTYLILLTDRTTDRMTERNDDI